jgi:cytochrome c-type biogenesis protein CcmF
MVHYFIGNLGHFLISFSFVAALLATVSYFYAQKNKSWERFANGVFIAHGLGVIGVVASLFYIINNHYYEYHYAWSHSSNLLPWYYQISCFWEGQEGSFLLWIFWNVLIGFVLIKTNRDWRPSVMGVLSITQLFLMSMILGVVVFNLKIGSSPFTLLREVIDAPIFKTNPDFVPEDGTGLNPLLQNYWMVIHPPTLFLGFATTVVPFAFVIAGLWRKKFTEWIRPALPWAQFSALVLGVGILMGAYWAYETLNFGGYWNWDPVENAIYVPWLVMVAAMHTMIAYKKNSSALKVSIILTITTFVLIVYSTFLTRSGVLGESSVHSFTDLGLSGQLLIYLIAFTLGSIVLASVRWKELPSSGKDVSVYSREFWIFLGAATLCLMALQVIVPTSFPVFNRIADFFGFTSNLAPPSVEKYSKIQLWFAFSLAVLSGTGQFFWWNKMDPEKLRQKLMPPIILALGIAIVLFALKLVDTIPYMLLLTAGLYSIIANASIFISLARSNVRLSGGAIAHMGIAMMLIGILFSSGYSKILSVNYTTHVWSKDFPDEVNRDNLLLFLNEPRQMGEYSMVYKGIRKWTSEIGYVDQQFLWPANTPNKAILTEDLLPYKKGDTLTMPNFENSYFEVFYASESGRNFTLYPRVQINETMDMVVYSPDIRRKWYADIYTHVRTFPDPEQEPSWSKTDTLRVEPGKAFFVNDYVAEFKGIETLDELNGIPLGPNDLGIKALIDIQGEYKTYRAEPIMLISGMNVGFVEDYVYDLGVKLSILTIQPQNNLFVFGLNTTQKDWIILEAVEKPLINMLWIGTFLLVIGLLVAIFRRYREFKLTRDKQDAE